MMWRTIFGVGVVLLAGGAATPDASALRQAVERALPLVERSAVEFAQHRDCFSCHHQALPVLAILAARRRGLVVDKQIVESQVERTAAFLKRNQSRYQEGQGQGGQVDTAGYALWTLASANHPPDDLTQAVCHYLLARQQDQDHWSHTSSRPPTEASDFTTTFLAIRGLQTYGADAQPADVRQRIDSARKWLMAAEPVDTEDRVFQLRGLAVLQAPREAIEKAVEKLVGFQRDDGGWSQTDGLESDAYATGSVLAALAECECVITSDPRYARGLEWLLRTQLADGSWHVPTRSQPIQEYFETGFPHGKDQFVSMAATCWAIVALAAALPEPPATSSAPEGQEAGDGSKQQAEIKRVLEQQAQDWNAGNLDGFMQSYWKSDRLSFSSGGHTTHGWQATYDRYRRRYADRKAMGHLTFSDLEVTSLGPDAALVLGRWQLERDADRPAGNFTLVLRRIDGRWLIIHDHTSRDAAE